MDLDEFYNSLLMNGNNENVEDEFYSFFDQEIEDDVKFQEDGVVNVEEEKQSDDVEVKILVVGDMVMKQGV